MKKSISDGVDRATRSKHNKRDDREQITRAADLVLNDQQAPVSCLVKDISKSGMKLIYDSPHRLPDQVKIVLHHPSKVFVCEVIWQNEKEVGLRIIETG